jgi:transglutaminase-like putative cysteine protease
MMNDMKLKNQKYSKFIGFILLIVFLSGCSSNVTEEVQTQIENTIAPTQAPTLTLTPNPTATQTPSLTPTPSEPLSYINPQAYSVTYIVTIKNGGFNPTDVRLYLPAPSEWDAQKDLVITKIDPEVTAQELDSNNGNEILYWKFSGTPASGETQKFTLAFDFTAYETVTYIDPNQIKPYQEDNPEITNFTKPETYVESTDPEITALADTFSNEEDNPYLLARKFYDYIIDHVKYKQLGQGLNGAKYLLDNGVGECGDYSALFIALCRASGIPARPVVGYWAISGTNQTHVWAEFYLEEIGWIPVDVTIGQMEKENRDYYFGNMDNQRVILSKGYNDVLVPTAPGNYVAPILQCPLWWYWGSGSADQFSLDRSWIVKESN